MIRKGCKTHQKFPERGTKHFDNYQAGVSFKSGFTIVLSRKKTWINESTDISCKINNITFRLLRWNKQFLGEAEQFFFYKPQLFIAVYTQY